MKPHFEIFDHTADMGMRVYAPTMSALLVPAAQGLYAMIGDLATRATSHGTARLGRASDVEAEEDLTIECAGDEPAVMLRDYLAELLYHFEGDKKFATAFDKTELSEHRLRASMRLSAIDETRSVYHHEVKAITYHELDIMPVEGGFMATVIVDI